MQKIKQFWHWLRHLKRRWLILGGLVLLALVVGVVAMTRSHDEEPTYTRYTVKAAPALVLQGKVNAASQVPVTVTGSGQYIDTLVSDGQTVYQGQALLEYRDDSQQTAVTEQTNENQATQTKVNNLTSQLNDLNQQLQAAKNNGDSDTAASLSSQVTDAKNSLADAQAELKNGQAKLSDLQGKVNQQFKAPVSGRVHLVDNGSGAPKVTILSSDRVIKAKVSEYDRHQVKADQEVTVTSDVTNKQATGQVLSVGSLPLSGDSANDLTQSTSYYLLQASDAIHERVGTSVHLKIQSKRLEVPSTAVFTSYGQQYVYRYAHGKGHLTPVTVKKINGVTYVQSGLKKGQVVISDPSAAMKRKAQGEVVVHVD